MLESHFSGLIMEAGCDEAGRGCLAGPVFAAAVILPASFNDPQLNDSKKLTPKSRSILRKRIEYEAISWAVASVDNEIIDRINILNASIKAMHMAINKLRIRPQYLLIDGNKFKPLDDIPFSCQVKGDSRFKSIAAASILAKTHRDEFMNKIHHIFPEYYWQNNKGYPTIQHKRSISEHGLTSFHRKSFHFVYQIKIEFQ